MVFILTPPIVIWCKKRFACTFQRRTKEEQTPITDIEMRTSTSSVWDSEIVAEIGDLGVCPTRLTVEKDIGEGQSTE